MKFNLNSAPVAVPPKMLCDPLDITDSASDTRLFLSKGEKEVWKQCYWLNN